MVIPFAFPSSTITLRPGSIMGVAVGLGEGEGVKVGVGVKVGGSVDEGVTVGVLNCDSDGLQPDIRITANIRFIRP
jgi:hypothetical protein